jgi:hypothetical protein
LLSEEQYKELCIVCDRILLAEDSKVECIAIPWLHIIREHPVFLNNYIDLFASEHGIKAFVKSRLRRLRNLAVWFRQLGRSFYSKGQWWFSSKDISGPIDVLFVSHLVSESHVGQTDDFYFGELPDELVKQGYTVVIALINHSGGQSNLFADKWKNNVVPRVILSGSLGISEEINSHRRLKIESFRLRKLASKETYSLFKKVFLRASLEALSNASLTTLRMDKQIAALVAKLNPKAIVITHEGHAWERITFSAARREIPEIRCFGYQHAALFRLQHAIRRDLSTTYNPDRILTAGTVSKLQLEYMLSSEGRAISVLGSCRSFKGTCPSKEELVMRSYNLTCLVIPEGIVSECYLLFDFSLACAQLFPEIQFIWRLHPIVGFESLVTRNAKLRNLPRNIVLSQATLEEDSSRSCWALYRGSSAVVSTIMNGVRPIYLQMLGEMTIDPIYELEVWRKSATSILDFKQIIQVDIDDNFASSEEDLRLAQEYCESFYLFFNVDVLTSLILEKTTYDQHKST